MKALTVNDALGRKDQIHGQCIEIEGLLSYDSRFDPPEVCLAHWPKAEQTPGAVIGIDREGVFSFNDEVMRRWSGKRVIVLGVFEYVAPLPVDGGHNGFGHFGLWESRIVARRIDLLKKRLAEHDGAA